MKWKWKSEKKAFQKESPNPLAIYKMAMIVFHADEL